MVLRVARLLSLAFVLGSSPRLPILWSQSQSAQPLTVRVEATPTTEPNRVTETLKVISELIGVMAWPGVFAVLLITQRRVLTRLLESVVELVGSSNRIKVGDLIDVEVDRSARQAEQAGPSKEISPTQVEAASRVITLIGDSDLPTVRTKMMEFAREYEAARSSMAPGHSRTRTMNAIVAKMRTLALVAKPLLKEFSADRSSPGARLAAIAILQMSPDPSYVDWLATRISEEQPFVFFHASLALSAVARTCGPADRKRVRNRIEDALSAVESFKGGPPDRNTVETLREALFELGRASNV